MWFIFAVGVVFFGYLWFAPALSVLEGDLQRQISPSQALDTAGENEMVLTGFGAFAASLAITSGLDWPPWSGFLLLWPVWIVILFAYGYSNLALARVFLRLKRKMRRRRKNSQKP